MEVLGDAAGATARRRDTQGHQRAHPAGQNARRDQKGRVLAARRLQMGRHRSERRGAAPGALHATQRELRRRRRQHVPIRLQPGLFEVGSTTRGLAATVACGRARHQEQQARRLHQCRAGQDARLRQRGQNGRDQLFVCAQEVALETSRSGAHQRDHEASESSGHLSGGLHSRCHSAHARFQVPVIVYLFKSLNDEIF